jgi:hypothetical protein
MDFDKLRSRWADPEYKRSLASAPPEPESAIIERMLKMDKRAARWRSVRLGLIKGPLAAILCLAAVQLFVLESREDPLQTAAFILAFAAMGGLNLVDKAREKCGRQRFWLAPDEFMAEEHARLVKVIPLDRWTSVFISAEIISLGLYAGPFLSAAVRAACWAAAGLAVVILQVYDCRRISELMRIRDSLEPQPDDPEDDEACE